MTMQKKNLIADQNFTFKFKILLIKVKKSTSKYRKKMLNKSCQQGSIYINNIISNHRLLIKIDKRRKQKTVTVYFYKLKHFLSAKIFF